MSEKYVLIGAGSAMFTRGLVADLLRSGSARELALVDTNAHALEVAERLARKMAAATGTKLKIAASVERRDVLRDATVVVCTIAVGGRPARARDVEIPRRRGIFAPVGDTVGPGGSSRALRMIRPMIAIAEDVLDLSPSALFFNHSNPLGPIVRAVRKETGASIAGLCHGVHHTARYLAKMLGVATGSLDYTAVGRNHLTWFTRIHVDQRDAMPDLRAIAARLRSYVPGPDAFSTEPLSALNDGEQNPFCWELFERFGAFPAPGDRHVTEYFPQFFRRGDYFGMTLGVHRGAFSFESTNAYGDAVYRAMERDAFAAEPLHSAYLDEIAGEHEQLIDIVDSIRADRGRTYSVNMPNLGAVPGLPPQAVVEAPAVAGRGGLHLLKQEPMAAHILGTLAARAHWDETIVQAAVEGSFDRFVQALVLDGYVESMDAAISLADELIAAHIEFLPWARGRLAERHASEDTRVIPHLVQ